MAFRPGATYLIYTKRQQWSKHAKFKMQIGDKHFTIQIGEGKRVISFLTHSWKGGALLDRKRS